MGGLESLNFGFRVVNFDTMKLIFCAIMSEALIPQGFLDIEKERKLQYHWYHNFRSYMVRMFLTNLNFTRKIRLMAHIFLRTIAYIVPL